MLYNKTNTNEIPKLQIIKGFQKVQMRCFLYLQVISHSSAHHVSVYSGKPEDPSHYFAVVKTSLISVSPYVNFGPVFFSLLYCLLQ